MRYDLEQRSYEVLAADCGEQALAMLSERPDVVITDINMPGMDGFELCSRIKAEWDGPEIPVILLTTLSDPADVVRGLECGADSFTVKPYDLGYLTDRIEFVLGNGRHESGDLDDDGLEFEFSGNHYKIDSSRRKILNLLLSSYDTATQKSRELADAQRQLADANRELERRIEERTAALREEVTERIAAEKKTEQNRAWLEAVLEAAPDGILIVDHDGQIIVANGSAETIFGVPAGSLAGMSVDNLTPSAAARARHAKLRKEYQKAPVRRLVSDANRLKGVRPDGTTFPIEVGLSPLITEKGNFTIATVRDVTEKRQLEHQFQQSQKMEALGQLTGGVAHDFNNLLGIVIGNLELLEQGLSGNDRALGRVATATKAALRGTELSKRLLAFSRRQAMQPEPTEVNGAVRSVIEMAHRVLGVDIDIDSRLGADLPRVTADPSELENVVLNLAVNAKDAMPKGGTITISTKSCELEPDYLGVRAGQLKPGKYVCISVSDTGTGIPKEIIDRVFEPFFTTKPRGKGTGLGLAGAYAFAKQMGGHTTIYSEVGHGTTVKIYLPFSMTKESRRSEHTREAGTAPESFKGRVLVVDDEVDLLEIAVAYLEEMGFEVFHATDGPSALRLVDPKAPWDLLLTDVIMPGGMNGAELADKIKHLQPDIKVIFSTGFPSTALSEKSGLRVRGKVLGKPYRRQEFFEAIHGILGGN